MDNQLYESEKPEESGVMDGGCSGGDAHSADWHVLAVMANLQPTSGAATATGAPMHSSRKQTRNTEGISTAERDFITR